MEFPELARIVSEHFESKFDWRDVRAEAKEDLMFSPTTGHYIGSTHIGSFDSWRGWCRMALLTDSRTQLVSLTIEDDELDSLWQTALSVVLLKHQLEIFIPRGSDHVYATCIEEIP